MNKLSSKIVKDVNRLRSLFPKKLSVLIKHGDNNSYCAEIVTCNGCFTEGNTSAELTDMINDAVRVYLGVPEKYFQFMPEYFPSTASIKQFKVFLLTDDEIKTSFNISWEDN